MIEIEKEELQGLGYGGCILFSSATGERTSSSLEPLRFLNHSNRCEN